MPRARVYCPPFPPPCPKGLARILKQDPSKTEKNEVILWNVKLEKNSFDPLDEVIMTRTHCISKPDGLEIKKKSIRISKKNYQQLLDLKNHARFLKMVFTTRSGISPDDGIELEEDPEEESGARLACHMYHNYLKDHFAAPWNRGFLCLLDLLEYEYEQ
jgi:hypothetical protein